MSGVLVIEDDDRIRLALLLARAPDREVIFDRFVPGRAACARAGTEAGPGQALLAEHAAAHGGRAAVTEHPGADVRFPVTLSRCVS